MIFLYISITVEEKDTDFSFFKSFLFMNPYDLSIQIERLHTVTTYDVVPKEEIAEFEELMRKTIADIVSGLPDARPLSEFVPCPCLQS